MAFCKVTPGRWITYRVLASQALSANIPLGSPVTTVLGKPIVVNICTRFTITDPTSTRAKIIAVNVRASNGVIHVIDKVLIPNPL